MGRDSGAVHQAPDPNSGDPDQVRPQGILGTTQLYPPHTRAEAERPCPPFDPALPSAVCVKTENTRHGSPWQLGEMRGPLLAAFRLEKQTTELQWWVTRMCGERWAAPAVV